jgi:hypothetical protein
VTIRGDYKVSQSLEWHVGNRWSALSGSEPPRIEQHLDELEFSLKQFSFEVQTGIATIWRWIDTPTEVS